MVYSSLFARGKTHWFSQGKYHLRSGKLESTCNAALPEQQCEFLHTTNRAAHLWLRRSTGGFRGVDAALWAFGMKQKNIFHQGHYLELGMAGRDSAWGGRSGGPWAARAGNAGENGVTEAHLLYLMGTPYRLCHTCIRVVLPVSCTRSCKFLHVSVTVRIQQLCGSLVKEQITGEHDKSWEAAVAGVMYIYYSKLLLSYYSNFSSLPL